ncbi:MAG: RNA-guided endonuclease InsQ/TnpB family protein, partial [Candidatus Odinarchaeota archaeon]
MEKSRFNANKGDVLLVQRVERIWIKTDPHISNYCHVAKNLYNETNYVIRQWFFKHGEWLRYTALNWLLKDIKQSENYKQLPAQTAQQTLRQLESNWKGFFAAIKDWKKHPDKYPGRPKLPNYLKKNGEFLLLFTNQQVKLKDGYIHFPRKTGLRLKTRLPDSTNVSGARIVPKGTGYIVEIIYKKDVPPLKMQANRIAGIDPGMDNLVTLVNNTGKVPVVIKGKKIKSLN